MFRAVSFMQLKNYKKALSEINIAITKNDQDPRTYKYRYDIRKRLDGWLAMDMAQTPISLNTKISAEPGLLQNINS